MKKLLILLVVLAICSASQAVVFEDDFDHITDMPGWDRINYRGWLDNSAAWSLGGWDGFVSKATEAGWRGTYAAYNHVETFNYGMGEYSVITDPDKVLKGPGYGLNPAGEAPGVLRIISVSTWFENTNNSAPFLYKLREGDFDAYVEVVGTISIWNNLGGLMARAPNEDENGEPGDGALEDWVATTYFPVYGVGTRGNSTNGGDTDWFGPTGYPCEPYLKLSRRGDTFTFASSADGITYNVLGSVERTDLPDVLQVGIMQGSHGNDWLGAMDFDNFLLVPEPATIALLGLGSLVLIRRKR